MTRPPSTRLPILAAALLLAACSAVLSIRPASAATSPRQTAAAAAPYKGWTVSSLAVRGLEPGTAGALRRGLVLSGRRAVLRTRRPLLFPRTLADDIRRTQIYLAQRGYPWAAVGVVFEPDQASRKVGVTLVVDPGPAVHIGGLEFLGLPAGHTPGALRLRRGAVLKEADLAAAAATLTEDLSQTGYPRPNVDWRVALVDSGAATVQLLAEPGPLCTFGEARLSGVAPDLRRLVLKNMELPTGELFTARALKRARTNLRELNLFRRIDVSAGEPEGGSVAMVAEVQPYKARSLELDLGYWTDDFLRAGVRWKHRNLFHGGRGAELSGFVSKFRRDGALSLWWPSLLGPRTQMIGRLRVGREIEEGYDLDSNQGELWASRRVVAGGWLQAGLTVADINVRVKSADVDAYDAQDGLLTAMRLRMSLDRIDDPVDPTLGTSWASQFEWSPPWLPSDHHYASLRADVTRYSRLGESVLALRLGAGLAGPLGGSVDLLPNKRFYAGGSATMRGARRRMLGPLDSDDAPLGGQALLLGSAELRFPLFGIVRGGVFADAGNVWRTRSAVDLASLEVAVGPSLMVSTPVGPVRADLGVNVTDRPAGEPGLLLHISVGHPF